MQVSKAKFVLQLEKKLICLKMFENTQPRTFFFILTHFLNLSCSRLIKFMVSKLEHAKIFQDIPSRHNQLSTSGRKTNARVQGLLVDDGLFMLMHSAQ